MILAAFRAAGYEPVHALLCAADYGVPQNRVRLFIAGFRDAVRSAAVAGLLAAKKSRSGPTEADKRIKTLERELRRKEAALAETAALLVLRKKLNALWGEEGEDT